MSTKKKTDNDNIEIQENEEVETVKFISKFQKHRLSMIPTRMMIQDGISYPVLGKAIQFEDFRYETSDQKEIAWLKKHRLFGVDIFEDKAGE